MNRFLRGLVMVLIGAGFLRSGNAEDKTPAPIPVVNKKDLSQALNKQVMVTGKVSRAGKSSSGHVFLNFEGNPQFAVFVDRKVVTQFQKVDPSTAFNSKTVIVRGTLERFKDKLQIRLKSPMDLSISEAPAKPDEKQPKPVMLKSIGKDAWISPAGVRYSGRDPEGLTRKDHVLRHAKDIPKRDGPHGVFDGGEELAFAWIDEAWQKVKTARLRPKTEEGRDVYTVSMGRRVGYLGGKTGAEKNHPPLTKVFLVVRRGTSEVITAFPR